MVAAPTLSHSKPANTPKPQAVRILVVGDSISAEYGLKRGTGWVALLENRLAESVNWNEKPRKNAKFQENATNKIANNATNTLATGNLPNEKGIKLAPSITVINASISGDTTAGGRARLAPLIDLHHPTHILIELGANDALRGLPVATAEANLNAMTQMGLQSGAKVLLLGMQIPPNYGADYTKQFMLVYDKVVKANRGTKHTANRVDLVPFMLKGVADSPEYIKLFQADRIHPTEAAQAQILDNVWPQLQKQLK